MYLPKEKVIASGDALQGYMPYMGDGYPYDWIKTLENADLSNPWPGRSKKPIAW